jgi:hypothetical protein
MSDIENIKKACFYLDDWLSQYESYEEKTKIALATIDEMERKKSELRRIPVIDDLMEILELSRKEFSEMVQIHYMSISQFKSPLKKIPVDRVKTINKALLEHVKRSESVKEKVN